jgi:hypothetical protein
MHKELSVLMFPLVVSIFLGMWSLMRTSSHLLNFILMPMQNYGMKFSCYHPPYLPWNIFPFAKFHPNANAKLWYEILLLPPSLLALESLHNVVNILDELVANNPNPANQISGVCDGVQLANLDDPNTEADSVPVQAPTLTQLHTGVRALVQASVQANPPSPVRLDSIA